MAFPTTAVLDSLQSAGGLSANWTTGGIGGDVTAMTEDANGALGGGTGSTAYWNVSSFGPDVEAWKTVKTLPASGFTQLWARMTNPPSATVTGYFLRVTVATGVFDFRSKVSGGTSTSLGTIAHAAIIATDSIGFSVVGTTLTAYFKAAAGSWTSLGSVTDSSISGTGFIGFSAQDGTERDTNFGGGTVVLPGGASLFNPIPFVAPGRI